MPNPAIAPLAANSLVDDNFLASLEPADLVYFCCNVGDADAQLLLLPEDAAGKRQAIVVDAGTTGKLNTLIHDLAAAGVLSLGTDDDDLEFPIALVVATHPHTDHIRGIPALLRDFRHRVGEYWDSGYYHPSGSFTNTMSEIELQPRLLYAQPTSGFIRWFGDVAVTVLAPAIGLRNRYDTYGVEINDASLTLRIEYPATRVRQDPGRRTYAPNSDAQRIILGADAQTLSWSHVMVDFPHLAPSQSAVAKQLRAAGGDWDALSANVFKISHHASKHGVNLELVKEVNPSLTLISSTDRGPKYGFPHAVSQELIREALDPIAGGAKQRRTDAELGVLYTCDTDTNGQPAGTIGVVLRPASRQRHVWRFPDQPGDDVPLTNGRRWIP